VEDYVIARADSISLLVLPPQLSPAARQKNTIPRSGLLIGVDGGATKTVAAAYDVASEVMSPGAKAKDELAAAWASLQTHVQEQFEKIRARLDEKRNDHDAKAAQRRAERAEANAADAADFAQYALDEAEAAALEAADARKIADALHPSTPSPEG
jgi:N-acetylglucosamine kinase-like BadF-type ATPase